MHTIDDKTKSFLDAASAFAAIVKTIDTPDEPPDEVGERIMRAFVAAYDVMTGETSNDGIVGGSGEASTGADLEDG